MNFIRELDGGFSVIENLKVSGARKGKYGVTIILYVILIYLFGMQQIVSDLRSPASGHARRWRALCLRLGKYRQRNPRSSLHSLIRSVCIGPLRNTVFPALEAVVSYGNHFHVKSAEIFSYLGIFTITVMIHETFA